jgi:hypothetical protein
MRAYWQDSRAPRYSLLFALPLFVVYQALVFLAPPGPTSGLRNGADVILQDLFSTIAGRHGPLLFMVCLVGAGVFLIARDLHAHPGLRARILVLMLGEAALLALVFGLVVGLLTSQLVRPAAVLVQGSLSAMGTSTRLMLSLGAGLYEELLFRVLLVGSLAWGGQRLLGWRPTVAGLWAVLVGALIFSAFHYIGPYGDVLRVYSFVFRAIAGVAFSALYLLRGFGITAWTHALYDALLLLR